MCQNFTPKVNRNWRGVRKQSKHWCCYCCVSLWNFARLCRHDWVLNKSLVEIKYVSLRVKVCVYWVVFCCWCWKLKWFVVVWNKIHLCYLFMFCIWANGELYFGLQIQCLSGFFEMSSISWTCPFLSLSGICLHSLIVLSQNWKPISSAYWSVIFFSLYQSITSNACVCVCVCVCVCGLSVWLCVCVCVCVCVQLVCKKHCNNNNINRQWHVWNTCPASTLFSIICSDRRHLLLSQVCKFLWGLQFFFHTFVKI